MTRHSYTYVLWAQVAYNVPYKTTKVVVRCLLCSKTNILTSLVNQAMYSQNVMMLKYTIHEHYSFP